MSIIYEDLHQFSSYAPQFNLTFHQYLLLGDEPLLVHTGSVDQAAAMVPELTAALDGRSLGYIFISHFESDECGGLAHVLEHFPEATPLCSEITARQLLGFGLTSKAAIYRPGEKLATNAYELEFISYPSEMHLWEGLLIIENRREVFFSSDLMFAFGEAKGEVVQSDWNTQIENIEPLQVPDPGLRSKLQRDLSALKPKFIATGHGPCLKLK